MIWIKGAEYLDGYRIRVWFNDGVVKDVDLKDKIMNDRRPVFRQLRDVENFKKVRFNPESDTVEWPGGLDLAPEFLYR
jgi:hypothetical protein